MYRAPNGVDEHPYFDPAGTRRRERLDEALAPPIVVEDVGQKRDRRLGAGDGLEHRGIGFVPVEKWTDAIPVEKRHARYLLHQVRDGRSLGVSPENPLDLRRAEPARRKRKHGPFALTPQGDRPPPDAVDADEVIKEAPEKRHQDDDRHPPDGRPDLFLI